MADPGIARGALTTIALLAAVVTSTTAYADDITVEQSPFVSSRSWEEASAELKTPLSRRQSVVRCVGCFGPKALPGNKRRSQGW
jgi:hypothetical protein